MINSYGTPHDIRGSRYDSSVADSKPRFCFPKWYSKKRDAYSVVPYSLPVTKVSLWLSLSRTFKLCNCLLVMYGGMKLLPARRQQIATTFHSFSCTGFCGCEMGIINCYFTMSWPFHFIGFLWLLLLVYNECMTKTSHPCVLDFRYLNKFLRIHAVNETLYAILTTSRHRWLFSLT